MITNPPGYGSCSLNKLKPAKVKVGDTRGQALLVQVPTQGLSVQADYHGTANACSCADAADRPREQGTGGRTHTSQAEFQVRLNPAKSLCDVKRAAQAPWASLPLPVKWGLQAHLTVLLLGDGRAAQVKVPAVSGPTSLAIGAVKFFLVAPCVLCQSSSLSKDWTQALGSEP